MLRLSSDYLFHFKRDVRVLCEILRDGFRYNLWSENLPYHDAGQTNFICCFCDILPSQAGYHVSCYGRNALALTKEWGIRQQISPVRYVHKTSVGVSDNYFRQKVGFRGAGVLANGDDMEMLRHYLCAKLLNLLNPALPFGDVVTAREQDVAFWRTYEKFFGDLGKQWELIPEGKPQQVFTSTAQALFNEIKQLHNELEARDAFMRAYIDDFRTADGSLIPQKVLYDEREWRSVKGLTRRADGSRPSESDEAERNGFLPREHNLRFSPEDLKFVVVAADKEKATISDFVASNQCLVSADDLKGKLVTFDELASSNEPPTCVAIEAPKSSLG